jgi:putative FmdB family regulatory protein
VPTYEYECLECGHCFERFQKITEEPVKVCPVCGGTVRRLLGTGAGVIYKGSGFTTSWNSKSELHCSKERPCCGREVPCDKPPCAQ